jgi:peptidoglycan/LPS O-acetylase OafA/YrhL
MTIDLTRRADSDRGSLFDATVEPRTVALPRVPAVPGVPAAPRRADVPPVRGRHSIDAGRWDEAGTAPIRIAELGVRPTARGVRRHRRPEPRHRIAALDGLRGIAALVVVVYHVLLTQVPLAAPYLDPSAPVDGAVWWASFTPLHLFWAGPEAVLVFFVLSGLVLALPVADTGRLNPWDYYPRRLVRLYLPVWAAVGLATAWAAAVPRAWPEGTSWWLTVNAAQPTPSAVLDDLLLVRAPGQAVHVLWSLQWEVVYCLLLPLVLFVVLRFPRLWVVKFVLAGTALVAGAALDSLALSTLPLFVLGTLMAVEHRRLTGWAAALDRSRWAQLWWTSLLAGCVTLLAAYWYLHALALPAAVVEQAEPVARALQGLGAALTVGVVWLWRGAQGPLTTPVMQWLGSRSFSLYLVHLPVVATVALLLGGTPPLLLALGGSLLVTLPLTEVFYRLVERPSHRVARRAGRAVAARVRSAPAAEVVPSICETSPIRLVPVTGRPSAHPVPPAPRPQPQCATPPGPVAMQAGTPPRGAVRPGPQRAEAVVAPRRNPDTPRPGAWFEPSGPWEPADPTPSHH